MQESKCCVHCIKRKEYYEENKDKIIERSLENYSKNKELILQKMKEYRESHKEEIKAKANEKVECECGGRYTKRNKSSHMKSNRHQKFITGLQDSV